MINQHSTRAATTAMDAASSTKRCVLGTISTNTIASPRPIATMTPCKTPAAAKQQRPAAYSSPVGHLPSPLQTTDRERSRPTGAPAVHDGLFLDGFRPLNISSESAERETLRAGRRLSMPTMITARDEMMRVSKPHAGTQARRPVTMQTR